VDGGRPYAAMCVRTATPNFHASALYDLLGTVWPVTPMPDVPPPGGCDANPDGGEPGNPDDDPVEAELRSECLPGPGGGGYGDGGDGGVGGFGDWMCGLTGRGVWDVYVDGECWGTITCEAEEVRFPVSAARARPTSLRSTSVG